MAGSSTVIHLLISRPTIVSSSKSPSLTWSYITMDFHCLLSVEYRFELSRTHVIKYRCKGSDTISVMATKDVSYNWKSAFIPSSENYEDLLVPSQDPSLLNTTSSYYSASDHPQSSNFCTSLHVSSSGPQTQMSNSVFLPQPYPRPQMQNLPHNTVFHREDLPHPLQQEDHELLGDVICGSFDNPQATENIPLDIIYSSFDNPQATENTPLTDTGEHVEGGVESNENLCMRSIEDPMGATFRRTPNHFAGNTSVPCYRDDSQVQLHSNPSSFRGLNKSRMQWTQELHECFVRAVNDLGGAERAKPKAVKLKMGVEGLTTDHVKSHLQKYRIEKHKNQAKQGSMRTAADNQNDPQIMATNHLGALRTQLGLQKYLHEQLKFHREEQLRAEKNARRAEKNAQQLQKLLEDIRK